MPSPTGCVNASRHFKLPVVLRATGSHQKNIDRVIKQYKTQLKRQLNDRDPVRDRYIIHACGGPVYFFSVVYK